jgi:hypothetical protein
MNDSESNDAVTRFGNAYGYLAKNLELPKTEGY